MSTSVIETMEALGIEIPKDVLQARADKADAQDRARQVNGTEVPAMEPAAILGKTWRRDLEAEALRQFAAERVPGVARKAAEAVARRYDTLVTRRRGDLLTLLQGWYVDHVDEFPKTGDPKVGVARRDEIAQEIRTFTRAHQELLPGGIGQADTKTEGGDFFVYFAFTPDQWSQVVDSTRPGLALYSGQDYWGLCLSVGATPRLVSSWAQADADYRAVFTASKHAGGGFSGADWAHAQSALAMARAMGAPQDDDEMEEL
ncbi:MAG: hypothetical protein LKI58_11250 [Actinomyces sp.]|nr:hypothetical protein [Actinomyces sp.]MCI1788615.1 hypothetical protein [Actinomyces sp.]MCI1829717.1 hypothetical protein [Actinomyces sp.]